MHFTRIVSEQDSHYTEAMALYGISFPPHEQREAASQKAILRDEAYHFDLIFDGERFVGEILYWETENFLYIEHFCINTELRGQRYGQQALELLSERGKTVILEIDPPVDDISIRRKGFYERAGYKANPFAHVHPPYHRGNEGHALVVMSQPEPLTEAAYQDFARYLRERVMANCMEG